MDAANVREETRAPASLRSMAVNSRTELLPYLMPDDLGRAATEMFGLYGPLQPLRKLTMFYGLGDGEPGYAAGVDYYRIGQVFSKVLPQGDPFALPEKIPAGGKGLTLPDAVLSSLGEGIERLVAFLNYPPRDAEFGSVRELRRRGVPCLGPEDLPLFSEEQYARPDFVFKRFTEDTPLTWLTGRRLLSGSDIALPAQVVALFSPCRPGEPRILLSTSGGLASHSSFEAAAYKGILEVLERDAINLRWVCGIPPEIVRIDRPLRPDLKPLGSRSLDGRDDIRFYAHTLDFPEVCVLTAVEISRWLPRFSYNAGGGADIDVDDCLLGAVREFTQSHIQTRLASLTPTWAFARGIERAIGYHEDLEPEHMDEFLQVLDFYGHPKNHSRLQWYLDGGSEVQLSSMPTFRYGASTRERLHHLLGVLESRGIDPIVFDLTPPNLSSFRIVKVIIPELTQAFLPNTPLLGHPRYRQFGIREDLVDRWEPVPYP